MVRPQGMNMDEKFLRGVLDYQVQFHNGTVD